MYDIITIGSATRDVFLISKAFRLIKSKEFATGIGECVSLGSKIELDNVVFTTGGGGTNSAMTFAQLGKFKTAAITRLGDDEAGRDILNELALNEIDSSLSTVIKKGISGYSTLLTTTTGERTVLVHRGVSADFKVSEMPWSRMKTKWLYVTSLAGNTALALKIVQFAKKNGIRVAYNPGSDELKKGLRTLSPIIKELTVLNMNLEEAQLLAKIKTKDVALLAKKIARPGLMLVLTDGPQGAYAHLDGTTWFARPRNIKVVSRTGAGDAFGSALVASLMADKGIDEALQIGILNSESVIQSYGAKIGILTNWPAKTLMQKIKIKTL